MCDAASGAVADVEDVLVDAVRAVLEQPAVTPDDLTGQLRHRITTQAKNKNPWVLAGDGWKTFTLACVQKDVDALNTPNSGNVNSTPGADS
ncbi:hypothetical protein AB0J38_25220 [Streptomyces sp. NPDC050095]|uniref:hypothetical protein n=1 Tax=unclassified Streptomyces TaxID=2593676 RepID=UPI00342E48D6